MLFCVLIGSITHNQQIKMPTSTQRTSGWRMTYYGGAHSEELRVRDRYREDPHQTKYAKVNLAEAYENGDMSEFAIREYIKRLGKNKYGGIMNFEVVVPKKFAKYLPKKKCCVLAELGNAIYAANTY